MGDNATRSEGVADSIPGQGAFATGTTVAGLRPAKGLSGWKIFAAVLGANLVTMGLTYVVIDTALSVQRTEAALTRANTGAPVYTPF